MGEILGYDLFFFLYTSMRFSGNTEIPQQPDEIVRVGNTVEIIYSPLFLGYKLLSGSISKFPQWSIFGIRSNTTIYFRRVWEKESRPLELKGFGNQNSEANLERMI